MKINRNADYSLKCIQKWLDAIAQVNGDFYFVCDNNYLKHRVLKKCHFHSKDIKFIPSMRGSIASVARNLYTGFWEAATYAHLTPFYHAKKSGVKKFWCIDADDTMLLMNDTKIAQALEEVESLSDREEITAISLDMWRSKTQGVHWSLGVLYINDNIDIGSVFERNRDLKWTEELGCWGTAFNLDWFMSCLKKNTNIKIETFYIEKAWFIHWGDFFYNPVSAWVNYWNEGKIVYPIIRYVFGMENTGIMDTADCLQVNIGLDGSEGQSYLRNEFCMFNRLKDSQKKLYRLNTDLL